MLYRIRNNDHCYELLEPDDFMADSADHGQHGKFKSMQSVVRCAWIAASVVIAYTVANAVYRAVYPRFLQRAMQQYRDYAFSRLTQKSLRSFSKEGTALYVSALTNDCTSIENNYLAATFTLIEFLFCFLGALIMMLYYSPVMLVLAVALSFLPVAVSMTAGNRLTEQEKGNF